MRKYFKFGYRRRASGSFFGISRSKAGCEWIALKFVWLPGLETFGSLWKPSAYAQHLEQSQGQELAFPLSILGRPHTAFGIKVTSDDQLGRAKISKP